MTQDPVGAQQAAGGVDDAPTVATALPLTRAAARAARAASARDGAGRRGSQRSTGPGGPADDLVPTPVVTVVATVALALLVGVSAASGPLVTGLAVGFVGVVLAWGWPRLLSAPTPGWSSVVIGAGSLALGLTVGLTQDEPMLRWLPATIGVSLVLAFLQQLLRRDRSDLTLGLSASVAGLSLVTVGAPLVALPAYARGPGHVATAMGAVAVAALADLLGRVPAVRRWVLLPVTVAGVAGALLVARLVGVVDPWPAALLGVVAGSLSHIVRRVLGPLPGAASLPARLSQAGASLLVVGVLVYLVTRVFVA